jgi:hypothetical protein
LSEAVVDVAARFGLPPADVLSWNASAFYATVDCLCNVAREEEAALEEIIRQRRRSSR